MCDSRLHEPLGTVYCPEATIFLLSILDNQKGFMSALLIFLEVYILISNLRQVSNSDLRLHWWRNEWKICSKNEVSMWREFSMETSSLPFWKERENSISSQHKHWYLDFGLPALSCSSLPALISQCWLEFDKD